MSNYQGDIALGATLTLTFNTNAAAGESATYTGGTVEVYKNADLAQSTAGVTVSKDHDGKTGAHLVSIVTSDAFYAAGDYHVMLIGATVDGKVVNAFIGSFSIANRPVQGMATALLTSIAAAVWNYATASAGAVTTFGGYILQQLGLLFNGADVVLQAPVLASGDVEVLRGDDYLNADGRALLWSSDDWTPLDLSTAQSVTFRANTRYSGTVFSKTLTVVSDTQIRLELETAETAAFAIGTNAYRFDISAVLFNDSIVTLARGQMTVLEDVR